MIQLEGLNKYFGKNHVLKDIDVAVSTGEVVSIIGASGSGKSTMLRCINSLEDADSGLLSLDQARFDLAKLSKKDRLWIRRHTAMVFQGFYLFNNKTALENIMEGLLIVKKLPKAEAIEKALEILAMIGLSAQKDQYPNQLSGGQQQRVAIGRAIAMDPKILLLDEPTSALDPELVNEVLLLIKEIAAKHRTMMIVTHEINFARNVSDRVIYMDGGKIIEAGPPEKVIDNPKEERTQRFLKHFYNRHQA